jgi:hypothetical protein
MDPAHEMAHDHAPAGGRETWRLAVAAPVICWLIGRGQGHAVMHAYH